MTTRSERFHQQLEEILDMLNTDDISTDTNESGFTFPQWYAQVDKIVTRFAGLGIEDLADGPSWDCWHDGWSPREYAYERLTEEGFPFDEEQS